MTTEMNDTALTTIAINDSVADNNDEQFIINTNLPNYLIKPHKKGDSSDFIGDVLEDDIETGAGYDSDDNADEVNDIDDEMHMARMFKLMSITDLDSNEDIEILDRNMVELDSELPNLKIHSVPDDWIDPPHDATKNEPPFESLDNPGKWSSFCYRPVFKKENGVSVYKHHCLPTGCMPVEKNADGKRIIDGWEFHYNGWCADDISDEISDGLDVDCDEPSNGSNRLNNNVDGDDHLHRVGANENDPFPSDRMGYLDADLLRRLGLTSSIMKTNDFLFFYQLLLPMCDTERSGIDGDGRLPYYVKLEEWSNLYAYQIGLGGSYGHEFKNVSLTEILRHDGCVIRDGVRGGSAGAIYRRWQAGADYDDNIAMSISFRRWLQVKRIKKLCNNDSVAKRGDPHYDPTYKYDYIFKCIIHNVNYLTEYAELDATIDETTYATASPGESGAGVTFRVVGKPNVSKGGQTVLVCDSHRVRPRAYYHRHKLHDKPDGWTATGMIEARRLCEKLLPMVKGSIGNHNKIYDMKPHITMDNFFSGEKILEWIGQQGFGATMTCRRDRLPPSVPAKYWHKQKTDTSLKTKVARFLEPVVAVKTVQSEGTHEKYRRVNVSFQSTSSCNISTVNALHQCKLSVTKRERGMSDNKRSWGIEMNAARELYLKTYSRIDSIDHLIKNCRLKYRSWKYWHSPMLHATALAIVVAYDMYLEVAEGELDADWKLEYPVDFWTFRDVLSVQMLEYDPKNRRYHGDANMRVCTKQNKRDREQDNDSGETKRNSSRGRPTVASKQQELENDYFQKAKNARGENSRLCGDLSRLDKHIKSVETGLKHPKACRVCGGDAYSICKVCGVPLHFIPSKGQHIGKMCFFDYHNDCFFGLAREDTKLTKAKKSDWVYPTVSKIRENAKKWKDRKTP